MSIKLPFKKHALLFVALILVIIGVFSGIGYIKYQMNSEFKAKAQARINDDMNTAQVVSLLGRLKLCAEKHNSSKFSEIHDEFSLKFYRSSYSLDEADIKPALIECNRLDYK